MQTAFELLRAAAARSPRATAIVECESGRSLTFGALLQRVEAAAAGFISLGWTGGSRVAVVAQNTIETGIAVLALHRAGMVPALISPRLKAEEITELIRTAGMIGCVLGAVSAAERLLQGRGGDIIYVALDGGLAGATAFGELLKEGRSLPPFSPPPESPAFIFYTSGTSGLPKAVLIPQRATEPRVLFMATQAGVSFGSQNRIMGLMPIYHVVGFYAVFMLSLAFNGTYFSVRDFDPRRVIGHLQRHRVTTLFATPTHLDALLSELRPDDDTSSLELVAFAGSPMPGTVLNKVHTSLPGRKINIYGSTEAMNSLFMRDPTTGTRLRPGFYSEVRVVEVAGSVEAVLPEGAIGELVVRAKDNDAMFLEYLGCPDATRERLSSGWYRTGDAALRMADGDMEICGRVDEVIISGGENIQPREVEDVLSRHPGVAEVAVVGIPDDRWGQMIVACVVCAGEPIAAATLDQFCKDGTLANFKRPRGYYFLERLPRNALGKVVRADLIREAATSAVKPALQAGKSRDDVRGDGGGTQT